MSLVLFAIIGAKINAGVAYWICYGLLCSLLVAKTIVEVMDK